MASALIEDAANHLDRLIKASPDQRQAMKEAASRLEQAEALSSTPRMTNAYQFVTDAVLENPEFQEIAEPHLEESSPNLAHALTIEQWINQVIPSHHHLD